MPRQKSASAPKPAGAYLRAEHKDGPQIVRSHGQRWSDRAEQAFLNSLAATCNVTASAEAIGYDAQTLWARRRRDPVFAERWRAALDIGYVRLETLLIERATQALAGGAGEIDATGPIPTMSVNDAMHLLKLHRSSVKGGPHQRFDSRRLPRDPAAARASILGKLERIERAQARANAAAASDMREAMPSPAAA